MDPHRSGGVVDEERIRWERDLYARLLDLGAARAVEPFLRDALACVVALASAERGYLELLDERQGNDPASFSLAHGFSSEDVDQIRLRISRGIIAEALVTGETVSTHAALLDDRFRHRESVQRERIEAVLCAPISGDEARGAIYLQGHAAAGPFPANVREAVERFAKHVAPIAGALLVRRRVSDVSDPLRELRARFRLSGVVGRSAALARAVEQAMLAAPLDVNVLLTGESGTGKGQLARAIHENGPRACGPFVELNCAAIPATLVESELFGARAGAHSEARRDRPGKVAAAEHGTLFLDEIAELPLESQAKVLHLLQSRAYHPLGATHAVRADVRLIAATNIDLEEAMRERRLREDLYYRLQVLRVRLPALRERRDDVTELAETLCRRACEKHSLPPLELSPAALHALEAADWPGNVRQLEHVLEAAAIRAAGEGSTRVARRHVCPDDPVAGDEAGSRSFQDETRRFQRELLERTLRETEWNVAETARRLDLARSHVYNLVKAFGLSRDDPARE
jgi:Nif-specific regulatory protein